MTASVVFIQGGGEGAHDEDAVLAANLAEHLGADFSVDFPEMPGEDEPDFELWRPAIGEAIARAEAPVVLVGHSLGGYFLIKYLAEQSVAVPVAAVCVIAAPFPSGDSDWVFDGFNLPDDFGARMPTDAAVLLYASEDDEVIPFAHRDLYAAAIPDAVIRTTSGGHQLGGDLRIVADDIQSLIDG